MLKSNFPTQKEQSMAETSLAQSDAVKLSKRTSGLTFSFLHQKESNGFYGISAKKLAGKSGESFHVKEIFGKDLTVYAGKVAAFTYEIDPEGLPEIQALRRLHRLQDVIVRKLDKPKAFKIYEASINERTVDINYKLYIIQTKIPGENLSDWLGKAKNRALLQSIPELRYEIVIKLITRLHQLQTLGIVHGDIKPENIMIEIDSKNQVHVDFVDFGNAALLPVDEVEKSVRYQGGTPLYRAPELNSAQANGSFILGYAGDIYSLTLILDEQLHLPFSNTLREQLLHDNRTQRATLTAMAVGVMEALCSHEVIHGLAHANLTALLQHYQASLEKIDTLLNTFKDTHELSEKQTVLTDFLLNPTKTAIQKATKQFGIENRNFFKALFASNYSKDEYKGCMQKLNQFSENKDLGSLIYSIKSSQRLLNEDNPIHQFYSDMLRLIQLAQGPMLIAKMVEIFPISDLAPLAADIKDKLKI